MSYISTGRVLQYPELNASLQRRLPGFVALSAGDP